MKLCAEFQFVFILVIEVNVNVEAATFVIRDWARESVVCTAGSFGRGID